MADHEADRKTLGQGRDVGDDADHPVGISGKAFQRGGHGFQGVLIEGAEALVKEHRVLRLSRSSWYWPEESSISVSEASVMRESRASPHSQRSNEVARSSWPSMRATCPSSRREK